MTLKGLLCLATLGLCAALSGAQAQSWLQRDELSDYRASSYPTRPITVVVPFLAGGPSDVIARIVTEQMGKSSGQNLVIENAAAPAAPSEAAEWQRLRRTATRCSRQHGLACFRAGAHAQHQV